MPVRPRLPRSLPIRPLLIAMLALPVASLVALWIFASATSISQAYNEQRYPSLAPRIEPLSIQLAAEREQSYIWLATGGRSPKAALAAAQARTDQAAVTAMAALSSVRGQLPSQAQAPLTGFFAQLRQLGAIRASIDSASISPSAAFGAYDGIVDAEFRVFDASVQSADTSLALNSLGMTDGAYALEMAGREAALVGGALAARSRMSTAERELFASTAAQRRLLISECLALLDEKLRAGFVSAGSSPAYQEFAATENAISARVGAAAALPVNLSGWQATATSYLTAMSNAEAQGTALLDTRAAQVGDGLLTQALVTGGLGFAAVVGSVVLLLWSGRRFASDLTRLHDSVRDMADVRLPRVVGRLQRGEDVDVAAESPPPGPSRITEIGRVAEAFATVQAAAVEAAVNQAKLRKGVNQVFRNLSMRSQSLLHRQLSLLDSMERRTSEPDALADLFRIDHLTTRMRRHAEGLIILSGAVPGRGWRVPVPMVDVLRAAVGEVEDYTRVDVVSVTHDSIAGSAVNDVIHLVAELIENAAAFSPPTTRIEIRASRVANGVAAEIEDRGLGLSADERAAINQYLAGPPEFDLGNSEQLGLFIVGQLAARHGIKVALRDSPFGGTTAVVLLPPGVVTREDDANAGADPQARAEAVAGLAGRHRLRERSPEARRLMMTTMQHGWQRGRLDDLDAPGGAEDDRTNR